MATPVTYLIGGAPDIFLNLQFQGRNAKGPRLLWTFPRCKLNQKKAIDLLGDKYSSLPFDCKVFSYLDSNYLDAEGNPRSIFGTVLHPDKDLVSPITSAYYIGSGIFRIWRLDTDSGYRHAGNVSDIKLKFDYKEAEHKQFMEGTASVDDETTIEAAMSLEAMLDEFTAPNVRDIVYGIEVA